MSRTPFLVIALATTLLLTSCGGSTNSSSNTSPMSNGVPMILTIGDTPPSGVAVLFLEALITKATLQSSDPSKPAVTVLSTPVEVEFGRLQTDRAFLSLANITPDTYKSITLTFGNATLTIENHSGAVFGSCANNSACELTPTFNPSTVTVSNAPFPITITQNSVVGLRLDFNVNSSVEPDLSLNPTVTLKSFVHRDESEGDKEMEDVDEVDGQVTSVGNNQFTLMNEQSGQSFNVSVNSSTVFEDFGRTGCTANPANVSCLAVGQILDVDLSESGMGATLAKRVELEESVNRQAIKGIITSVDSATQFHMVVFNEEPTVAGISEGSPVVVTIQPSAVFQVGSEELGEDGGFSNTGLSFASGTNLLVGQDVQIRPGTASTSEGVTTLTTDLVRLWPSQITGTVGSVDTSTGKFTLTGLSPLFTGATPPVTTITVETLSNVLLMDGDSSQSALPAVGSSVSVKGLLFITPGTPTLLTRTMREQHDD
jgi:Domain of unknown function (DUF5666)